MSSTIHPLSRRSFLRQSAAGGFGMAIASYLEGHSIQNSSLQIPSGDMTATLYWGIHMVRVVVSRRGPDGSTRVLGVGESRSSQDLISCDGDTATRCMAEALSKAEKTSDARIRRVNLSLTRLRCDDSSVGLGWQGVFAMDPSSTEDYVPDRLHPVGLFKDGHQERICPASGSRYVISLVVRCLTALEIGVDKLMPSRVAIAHEVLSNRDREEGALVIQLHRSYVEHAVYIHQQIEDNGFMELHFEPVDSLPAEVLRLQARGTLNFLRRALERDGFQCRSLRAGVHLTGDCYLISGLDAIAQDVFGIQAFCHAVHLDRLTHPSIL